MKPCADTPDAHERGFTLVEVVTTIVIMGLVMAPLCTALIQAMNLIPASSARTQVATDTDRMLSVFSDDVIQAQAYTNSPAAQTYWLNAVSVFGSAVAPTAPASASASCPLSAPTPVTTALMSTMRWDMSTATTPHPQTNAWWRLRFTNPGGGSPRLKVEVQRSLDNWATSSTYLTAYCAPGQSIATVTTKPPLDPVANPNVDTDGSIQVKFVGLMDQYANQLGAIDLSAKMRTSRILIDPNVA